MGRSHRSASSGGSIYTTLSKETENKLPGQNNSTDLWKALYHWHNSCGKHILHHKHQLATAAALLVRLQQQQEEEEGYNHDKSKGNNNNNNNNSNILLQWLVQPDQESRYTPLHDAIYRGDLAMILLLLKQCQQQQPVIMDILSRGTHPQVLAQDAEGFRPADLLATLQVADLRACRLQRVYQARVDLDDVECDWQTRATFQQHHVLERENSNASIEQQQSFHETNETSTKTRSTYGCEVFTFGRAHHCALGAGVVDASDRRPRRVPTFAPCRATLPASAVAVSAAAHHTLVVAGAGHVYAFGLGKGGRLGTGDELHQPLPVRVLGAIANKHVVSVAAAENHSLCVTECGSVYSWGSNRFGQLGMKSTSATDVSRCLPRRVDDLKNIPSVAVAAGARHSVALTERGEVYVWGDNKDGQLGLNRRNGVHNVQRVEALWKNTSSCKAAIAIAAADHSTLILTTPTGSGLPVNSLYSWGHGNHIPTRVQFSEPHYQGRPINPVAIACARYHNAAVTSDGLVYTWGLHAEPLGTASRASASKPQLVAGMLPENGGGLAVAVSASENHTAVITESGALFTWGATIGKGVLGHSKVRWQEEPKKVASVYRAVGVSAAKEHTVLLVGIAFPPLPNLPNDGRFSLEMLAARSVAENVDLFNAIPCLVVAERMQCPELTDYCSEFVRRNIDGVLNSGQRSAMDCYLNERLSNFVLDEHHERDNVLPPILQQLISAGNYHMYWSDLSTPSSTKDWIEARERLSVTTEAKQFIQRYREKDVQVLFRVNNATQRLRARSGSDTNVIFRERNKDGCSDRCLELTTNVDLSSAEVIEVNKLYITKEMRGTRKRLNYIQRLELCETDADLTDEQHDKIARRPQLEADLRRFESAVKLIEQRLQELPTSEGRRESSQIDFAQIASENIKTSSDEPNNEETKEISTCFRCDVCRITCPDAGSHASHITGRKHRNRISQAAEEERRQISLLIMEEKARQQLQEGAEVPTSLPCQVETPTLLHWEKSKSTSLPKFRLPGPPHGTPSFVVPTQERKCPISLLEIMQEESSKQALTTRKVKRCIDNAKPHALMLPPGAPPALKSPPWATLPPVATTPVHRIANAPTLSMPSLGDFFATPVTSAARSVNRDVAWRSPAATSRSPAKSTFRDIQQEEEAFKDRQDKTYATSDTKWLIEKRERASSFKEIEKNEEEERKEREFIEEQYQIEKQIKAELDFNKKVSINRPRSRNRGKKDSQKSKSRASSVQAKLNGVGKAKPKPREGDLRERETPRF
jgi:alpha-tubulin suppressor-like RCC1 family protein